MGTNGPGDPRIPVSQVEPGSIVCFGIDDDSTCLVVSNTESSILTGEGKKPTRKLVYFGCFCKPGDWEHERLFSQDHALSDTISVLMVP